MRRRPRQAEVRKVWPAGQPRGFSKGQGSRSEAYPKHLLDGMLRCACCKLRIALVSGKRGGYYGCAAATRRVCDNRLTVCRSKVERIFFAALRDRFLQPAVLRYALGRVAQEIERISGDARDSLAGKQAELNQATKRLARLVDFVASGHASDSPALGAAITQAEARVSCLQTDVEAMDRADGPVFELPSEAWLRARVGSLQALLERRTPESAAVAPAPRQGRP